MSITEKAAYLRGLYDGMELGEEKSKEAKMLGAIVDLMQELAAHVSENEESISAIADQVDDLAETFFDDDDEEEEDFDEDEEFEDEDDEFVTTFEVECPNCQKLLTIGEEELSTGEIECSTCGQRFQIDLQFENDDEAEDGELLF